MPRIEKETTGATDRARPGVEDYTFHRFAPRGDGIGIVAESYSVTQPVAAHRHDYYEIAFALAGSGRHEDEGGCLPILSGDVWIVRPGEWHAYPIVGGNLTVFNLLIRRDFLAAYAPDLESTILAAPATSARSGAARQPSAAGAVYLRLSPQGLDRVRALLGTLSAELHAPPACGQHYLCAGLALQILGLLGRYGSPGTQQSPSMLAARHDPGLLAAVQHIEHNYQEPITLGDLARRSGYAATYLSRKFKQHLGIAPSDYVLQVRLHHACALLQGTDLSITAIARRVGFSDSRYFAVRFHHAVGMTPTRFRRAAKDKIADVSDRSGGA